MGGLSTILMREREGSVNPAVSIILPTYNRVRFLPEAIQSIRDQQWTDWELIIVDDGSTDETPELIKQLTAHIEHRCRAFGKRTKAPTRLQYRPRLCRGQYIAFFDSDDLWLPHHLQNCIDSLQANADVDWVYGASRVVEDASGRVLEDSTFYVDGKPRPFMKLSMRESGPLRIIEDRNTVKTILGGDRLVADYRTQCFRRRAFDILRFPPFKYVED